MDYLTFGGVSGIGTITFTLTEPLVIGQPLGTLSLGVLPSIALDGNAFFEMPSDLLHWTSNGIPVNPSGFSVVVGKPVNLTAYTAGNTPVYHTIYTPISQITFLQTYVNITAFQFNNLNSTDEVSIQATSQTNITQTIALIGPYGTASSSYTAYLPSGQYTFRYTELNYTTGDILPGTSTSTVPLANYSGEYWVTLAGITVYQIGQKLVYENSSIAKDYQSLSFIISINDSDIKNLSLKLINNLKFTNDNISNVVTQMFTNFTFQNDLIDHMNISLINNIKFINTMIKNLNINETNNFTITNSLIKNANISQTDKYDILRSSVGNLTYNTSEYYTFENDNITGLNLTFNEHVILMNDTIKNLNLSFNDKVAILNSTLNNVNLNSTTYFEIEHDIINNLKANQTDIYKAEEISGAYSYKLVPENATIVPGGIEIELWVENSADQVVNNQNLVYYMFKNLSAEIISAGGTNASLPTLISYNPRYMLVEFNLTKNQINNIETGANNTVLQLYTPFKIGGISNIATGSISPATTSFNLGIWEQLGFSTSPPPFTGIGSIGPYITWILYNAGGRAIAGLVAIATLLYFAIMLNKKDKVKGTTRRNIITNKKVDAIYDKVVGEE